jgi:integrase/recombinase XerC
MKPLKILHEDFLSHMEFCGRSPHTIRMLRHCVGHTLRWLEETQRVTGPDQLNRGHLELWVKTVQARRTTKGLPRQLNTLIKQYETDRVFIQWLEKRGALPAGLHETLPRVKQKNLLPTSVLTHEQMEQLLSRTDITTTDGFQLRAMQEFLYTSGVRIAELLGLNLDSVDLVARTARVIGKGQKERMVPFGLTAHDFLEAYLTGIRPLRLRDPFETALWLDRQGSRMPYHTFRRDLIEVVDAAGLDDDVRPHTFRRSCATVLLRGGANVWYVKDLLGHERVDTLDPYLRLLIDDLRKTHAECHPREKDYRNENTEE